MNSIYDLGNLILDRYGCTEWLKGRYGESTDTPLMSPLEGEEETPDKLLIKFPVLLAQIKAGNNS